ncbi:MAG: peptide ABC transporter substrate-binding protein [Spirochaetota bacterium]
MIKKVLFMLLMALAAVSLFAEGAQELADDEEVVFRLNNGAEPESLDPALISGVPEHQIYMGLFEGLVVPDPRTLQAQPGVAESWEMSEDGRTYTFNLREDAAWNDGTPITAQTVVDSWLRFLDPDTAADYTYLMADEAMVAGASEYNSGEAGPEAVQIRAVDDHTFEVTLDRPRAFFVDMLVHYAFAIHPLHVIEEYGEAWTRPANIVSNGPFKLDEWIPQDRIELVKDPAYWDAENVQLDRVVIYPIDDQNTALNLFQDGQIDWIQDVAPARLEEMKQHPTHHANPAFISYYYEFNTDVEPLDDARVRRALTMAIDRQELVTRVTRGDQFPAFGITPPLPGVYEAVVAFEEDYDAARELLEDAGFPGGEGFPELTILYNTSEGNRAIAEYVQQKWNEELGINVEIENQEWGTYLDSRDEGNFEIARGAWQGDYVDPLSFVGLFTPDSPFNSGDWVNEDFVEALEEAENLVGEERLEKMREAETILIQDGGVMPFYYYVTRNWIDTDVWGGWYTTVQDMHPLKSIYRK